MKQHTIYCSTAFLEKLYDNIDKPLGDWLTDNEGGDSETLINLYRLIHDFAIVITNEDVVAKSKLNPNFKKLFKSGKSPIVSTKQFELIKELDTNFFSSKLSGNTLFFLDEQPEVCKEIENRFGYMAFSHAEFYHSDFLFSQGLELFLKNTERDWEFISKYKHPFNAMVISDAYLLCTGESRNNLKELLEKMLPKVLQIDFDLTIISSRNEKGLPSNLEGIKNELEAHLANKFLYKINLTLVLTKIHDRNLITNYLWCSSGYGFELIKNGSSCRNTHLVILPTTLISRNFKSYKSREASVRHTNETLEVVESLIDEFKTASLTTLQKLGLLTNVVGPRKNRLLMN